MHDLNNNKRTKGNARSGINGLNGFIRKLEKHLFSDVFIRSIPKNDDTIYMIIEVHCNFNLTEVIHHIKNGIWGDGIDRSTSMFFSEELSILAEKNNRPVDIEEITIFFNGTTIVLNRIYEKSVPGQLENIIQELEKNHLYLTKGKTEIPFEIHIPVFEENMIDINASLIGINTYKKPNKDYFGFWGVYYNSQEDALIYDLTKKAMVCGDLYVLDR